MSTSAAADAKARREAYYVNDLLPTILHNPTFLANNQYQSTFANHESDKGSNFDYRMIDSDEIATFNLVGEIGKGQGTALGPTGNHRMPTQGESPEPICDGSRVKNVITLVTPAWAPTPLKRFINNQIATADDVIVNENPTRPPDSVFYNIDSRIIRVHFQKRFVSPAGTYNRPKATRMQKVDVETGLPSTSANDADNHEAPSSDGPPELEVGGLYDPALQVPYDRRIFRLVNDRLRQYDIRDVNNDLIPVWDLESHLPPGTLVLVNVTMHCFNIGPRRYYQLLVQKLRVLDESAVNSGQSADAVDARHAKTTPSKTAASEFEMFATRKRASVREGNESAASSSTGPSAPQSAPSDNNRPNGKRGQSTKAGKGKDKAAEDSRMD